MKNIIKIVFNSIVPPIINGIIFFLTCIVLASIIMAPIVLYLGTIDGLWNQYRTIFVIIGLPAISILLFNFKNILAYLKEKETTQLKEKMNVEYIK